MVSAKLDEKLSIEQDRADKAKWLCENNLGNAMRLVNYSKKLEKLIMKEASTKEVAPNKVFWIALASYFGIPVEECDPEYWQKI